ncbi:MAG TPA: hypothetical protein VM425_02220 [Myxococcota bacterium]|nr:hypothetical protein [Myxococcota bacterium]
MRPSTITPEQRRRRLIPKQEVFTVQMAGQDVQRRFLLGQRLFFGLAVWVGLGAMWAAAVFLPAQLLTSLRWPLFTAALLFVALGTAVRVKSRFLLVTSFFLAFICLGTAIGSLAKSGQMDLLMNPVLVIGLAMFGCALNPAIFKKPRTAWAQYLMVGPWFATGCALAFFFPAGELALAISGGAAALLVFLALHAADRSLKTYHPSEVVPAAADVFPTALLSVWRAFSGQN